MNITIRPARAEDAAIVPGLMLHAMSDVIYSFIQQQDEEEALHFLTRLFMQPGNIYSYQHTFVAVDTAGNIAGSVTGYDGDNFARLRQPVLDLMKTKYNNTMVPEAETAGGEFYLDTVAVSPAARGQGIGTLLLKHMIDYARQQHFKQAGLLVDLDNPEARRLYERLGFNSGPRILFAGKEYDHMSIGLQNGV